MGYRELLEPLSGFLTPAPAAGLKVGLWSIDGTLLASTVVTSADPISAGFRFAPITPLALTADQDYVVAGLLDADNDGDYFIRSAVATTIPEITWVESRGINVSTLTFPDEFLTNVQGYFGANVSVIPEPSSLVMLAMCLLLSCCRRRLRQ